MLARASITLDTHHTPKPAIVDQANFRAQHARGEGGEYLQILAQQLRHQNVELSSRTQESEKSRHGQLQLVAELRIEKELIKKLLIM